MNQPLTIYIADDHKILAQALGGLIQQLPEVEELKIFHDGKQLFLYICLRISYLNAKQHEKTTFINRIKPD